MEPCICSGDLPYKITAGTVLGHRTQIKINGKQVGNYTSIDLNTGVATGWKIGSDGRIVLADDYRGGGKQMVSITDQLAQFELSCRTCDSTFYRFPETP